MHLPTSPIVARLAALAIGDTSPTCVGEEFSLAQLANPFDHVLLTFSNSPPPETAENSPPDPAQDRTQRQLRLLERFAEINLIAAEALGERIVRRAAEEDPDTAAERAAADAALGSLALGLERVGRSLRRCLAMETLTAEQGVARELLAQAERAQKAAARRERVSERRNAVQVAMTGAIDRPARPETEVDRLLDDLNDWMDAADDEAFAAEGPLGAILWTACKALDLPVDLTVWEHEDWAAEEIVQRPQGSPYRAHRVTRGPPGLSWSEPDPRDLPDLPEPDG